MRLSDKEIDELGTWSFRGADEQLYRRLLTELKELRAIAEAARDLKCPTCGWEVLAAPLKLNRCERCTPIKAALAAYFALRPENER